MRNNKFPNKTKRAKYKLYRLEFTLSQIISFLRSSSKLCLNTWNSHYRINCFISLWLLKIWHQFRHIVEQACWSCVSCDNAYYLICIELLNSNPILWKCAINLFNSSKNNKISKYLNFLLQGIIMSLMFITSQTKLHQLISNI
jgi:hypothetical protein